MSAVVGTWQHVASENLDAYMNVLNIPEQSRNMMEKHIKGTLTFSVDGNTWTVTARTGEKETVVKLKVGEVSSYKAFSEEEMTGIIKSVGEKIEEEHTMGDTKIKITREVVNGQLCITLCVKGVTAKLLYNKK